MKNTRKCKNCGADIDLNHKGPCPECRYSVSITIPVEPGISHAEGIPPKIVTEKNYVHRQMVYVVLSLIFTSIGIVIGYLLGDLIGTIIGALIGLLAGFCSYLGFTKVNEKNISG